MLTKNTEMNRESEEASKQTSDDGSQNSIPKNSPGVFRTVISAVVRGAIQIILMVAVLAGSYIGMNRLIDAKPEVKKRSGFRTVYTVQTVPVMLRDYRPTFTVYGESIASRTVDLRSLVAGEAISVSPNLKAGARVAKGEALVEIDTFNFEGAMREARANRDEVLARIKESQSRIELEKSKVERLNEQLVLAQNDYKRIAGLRANGTTTQKQLDDRSMELSQRAQAVEQSQIGLQTERARLEQQKAALERLKWRLEQAQRNLSNTVLKAPFNGIVRSTGVEVGKTLSANDVVVSIYEDEKIDIRFTLTDERYGRLQADKAGVLERQIEIIWAIGGQEYNYPAKIDRVGADISSNRGGVEVFANLQQVKDNPAIRPGAFVEIRVPDVEFKNTALVPESAIYNGEQIYLKRENKLVSQKIQIFAYDKGSAIISGKISNGDRVLITRIAEISDDIKVREEGDAPLGDDAGIAAPDAEEGS